MGLLLLTGAPTATVQQVTGNLEGRILDESRNPVAYANIVITSSSMQGARGSITDKDGYFHLQALPVGTYSVNIEEG